MTRVDAAEAFTFALRKHSQQLRMWRRMDDGHSFEEEFRAGSIFKGHANDGFLMIWGYSSGFFFRGISHFGRETKGEISRAALRLSITNRSLISLVIDFIFEILQH